MIQLFILIVITILCGSVIGLQIQVQKIDKSALRKDKNKLNWYSKILLVICGVLIVVSFYLPFLLKTTAISTIQDLSAKGQVGDAISGIMNPFIGIAGVIVTGLAFWIQYQANLQVQEQFTIQQFDAQFYEMIRLHKENVNEMEIEGYIFSDDIEDFKLKIPSIEKYLEKKGISVEPNVKIKSKSRNNRVRKDLKLTKGRKVFVTMKTEFECILELLRKNYLILNEINFNNCYEIFFFGIDHFEKKYGRLVNEDPSQNNIFIEFFINDLKTASANHRNDISNISEENRKIFKGVKLYFNFKPFSGHSSRLGHYYRHLFLIVKSIVSPKTIELDEQQKKEYLKILRAQLSNHEQTMLFYNWLGNYGKAWQDDKNRFFTKYNMIHNLWYTELFDNEFIHNAINSLKVEYDKDFLFRKETSNSKSKEMFEIDES